MTGVDGLCPSFASRTPDCVRLRRVGFDPYCFISIKKEPTQKCRLSFGAGDRGRRALPVIRFANTRLCSASPRRFDPYCFISIKKEPTQKCRLSFGAGDRGRTGTVSLPLDFESSTSANSITPANITDLLYYILLKKSIWIFYLAKYFEKKKPWT